MTSYIAQTRYRPDPDRWGGSWRYATREEAEACLADLRTRHGDILIETRIVESPGSPTESSRPKNLRQKAWKPPY